MKKTLITFLVIAVIGCLALSFTQGKTETFTYVSKSSYAVTTTINNKSRQGFHVTQLISQDEPGYSHDKGDIILVMEK